MAQGENFKRKGLPTMQMLQFLMELERIGGRRGSTAAVAKSCGVNHSSVSRYFKLCREQGLLTEELVFTGKGKIWLEGYRQLLEEIPVFLRRAGIPDGEIQENVRRIIEHLDYHTLAAVAGYLRGRQEHPAGGAGEAPGGGHLLREILEYGTREVFFMLFQVKKQTELSMANRGFCRPAQIRRNRRGSWLELEPCEMCAWSPVEGRKLQGHLETLKYEQEGILRTARKRQGKIRIPLDACHIRRMQGGGITAWVPIIATCNVGRLHMPESTARLVFWL